MVGLDCISGSMPGRVLQTLGEGGFVISYGQLSGENISNINPVVLIYKHHTIDSFLVGIWMSSKSDEEKKQIKAEARKLISEV